MCAFAVIVRNVSIGSKFGVDRGIFRHPLKRGRNSLIQRFGAVGRRGRSGLDSAFERLLSLGVAERTFDSRYTGGVDISIGEFWCFWGIGTVRSRRRSRGG